MDEVQDSGTILAAHKHAYDRATREDEVIYIWRKVVNDNPTDNIYYVRNKAEGTPEGAECVAMVKATGEIHDEHNK